MSLSSKPIRPLTSREISHILSSVLGGFAGFCEPKDIAAALDHFQEFRVTYMGLWRSAYTGDLQGMNAQIERLKGTPT